MAASRRSAVVLKAVKKILVQFCPYESNVRSTREFLFMVGSERARATNMNCEVTTMIRHDRSEPLVDITFTDGERLLMKGERLTSKEMLQALQSRCLAKDPQANPTAKK